MKLAICNELFVDWPIDRAFDFARQCGYAGVEIAPFTLGDPGKTFDVKDVSADRRAQVRRQAEKSGLDVVGLHWLLAKTQGYYLTSPDAAVRRATSGYLLELARLCRDLGGSILVLGSPQQRNLLPGVSHEEALRWAADVLCGVMPLCKQLDLTIAVEPLGPAEGNFLLTAEAGRELVDRVGSTHCRLHLDCKAMTNESQTIPQIIHASRKQLVHFHANDPNLLGPGMGKLDFVPILTALRQIGYTGWLSVEVFDYAPGAERIASESAEYLRRELETLDRTAGDRLT